MGMEVVAVVQAASVRPAIKTFRITCDQCPSVLVVDGPNKHGARLLAEKVNWIRRGNGYPDPTEWVCPAHTIPCPHCEQPISTTVELAARQRLRDKARERMEAFERYQP